MKLNAYPAKIFIGDTFCYFAGIILALASIWGICSLIKVIFRLFVIGSFSLNSSTFYTQSLNYLALSNALAID